MKNSIDMLSSSTVVFLCGCIGCRPDLYCQWPSETEGKCRHPASFPVGPKRARWCNYHFRAALIAGLVTDEEFKTSLRQFAR